MTDTDLRIGTCSWVDKSLVKSATFYPRGWYTPEARLRFYSSIFPTVEVDTSYYAIPSRTTTQLWADRTPGTFKFHIKAFRLFTGHSAQIRVLPRELHDSASDFADKKGLVNISRLPNNMISYLWDLFSESISPLFKLNKLGVVLFQFAPCVYPNPETFRHILDLSLIHI